MTTCEKCGARFNWVSVIDFIFKYSGSYIWCYGCFRDIKIKPSRRGLVGWAVLVLTFLVLVVVAVIAFYAVIPDGKFDTGRPIGETDTIWDTRRSLIRESAGATILLLTHLILILIFMALSVFIPVKRIVDFISVGFEQKRDKLRIEASQAE